MGVSSFTFVSRAKRVGSYRPNLSQLPFISLSSSGAPDLGPLPAPCVLIPFSSKEPYQQSPLPIPRLRGGGWLVTGESR